MKKSSKRDVVRMGLMVYALIVKLWIVSASFEMNQQISIATYNVQFSQHPEKIIENVLHMVRSGVSILCLQEVVNRKESVIKTLLSDLGNSWEAACYFGKENNILGMGNCIVWDTKAVSAKSKHFELLPYSQKLAIHEKAISLLASGITSPFKRRMVLINFSINGTNFCVVNIHLDHNGGTANRLKQLDHVIRSLKKNNRSEKTIICGDFNCLDLLNNGTEYSSYKKLLGHEYNEATENIDWTADLHDIDTSIGNKIFGKLIRILKIHVRKKLDFIWTRNIKLKKCEKLDVQGSDHKPVIAELSI